MYLRILSILYFDWFWQGDSGVSYVELGFVSHGLLLFCRYGLAALSLFVLADLVCTCGSELS